MTSINTFRMEILPVSTQQGVFAYLGHIHGLDGLDVPNTIMASTRREVIDRLFDFMKDAGIQLA
jgi:hypothetical protein